MKWKQHTCEKQPRRMYKMPAILLVSREPTVTTQLQPSLTTCVTPITATWHQQHSQITPLIMAYVCRGYIIHSVQILTTESQHKASSTPLRTGSWNFQLLKIEDGERPPFKKMENQTIEQYLIMWRPVRVKSAINRVGKSRILCYVIYFTHFP